MLKHVVNYCLIVFTFSMQFNLTKVETGLVFVINGGTYALTAPFWGRLCDKLKRPRFLTLLGAVFILIGFLFIGPIFFIPFDT